MKFFRIKLLTLLCVGLVSFQAVGFVTVGISNDCDYDNLLDAFLDDDLNIRVTSEVSYTDDFVINKPKIIIGGYDSCQDAENNNIGQLKSQWDGQNNRTAVKIDGDQEFVSLVVINNFEILNGENIVFAGAGGLSVKGKSNVVLTDVEIHNNEGNEGGGVRVTGNDARLTIIDTRIHNNQASGYGGGVYCESGAVFNMSGESAVHNNTAVFNGGGIFGNAGCQVDSKSGDTEIGLDTSLGIYGNSAESGGGVYLQRGSNMLLTGNDDYPAGLVFNQATAENSPGGGGIYLTGADTSLTAINAKIEFNLANTLGAGFVVEDFAQLTMHRAANECWDNNRCSSISQNFIVSNMGEGAAGYVNQSGEANIGQTYINGNRANLGAIFAVAEAGYLRLEGSLLTENGPITDEQSTDLFSLFSENNLSGKLDFIYNTLTQNNTENVFYLSSDNSLVEINIFNSIIWQEGEIYAVDGINPISQISCSVVNEVQSLVGNIGFLSAQNPRFRNTELNDFRLLGDSSAVDFCDEALFNSEYNDLNAQIRGVDTLNIDNNFGPYDAGTYEYLGQNNDIIFRSDFD